MGNTCVLLELISNPGNLHERLLTGSIYSADFKVVKTNEVLQSISIPFSGQVSVEYVNLYHKPLIKSVQKMIFRYMPKCDSKVH